MPTPVKYVTRSGSTTWRIRFRHPSTGKQTTLTFPTKRAADVFAADIKHHGTRQALAMQESTVDATDTPTMDDASKGFFAWKENRVRSDRTVADYRRDWDNWVSPTFGTTPIRLLERSAIQAWVDAMHDGTLDSRKAAAPKSIADRHFLVHAVCAWAVDQGLLTDNPAVGTRLPKRRPRTPKGLRPAEWQALHAALRQIDPDAADLAEFLVGSGWRWSEATALTTFEVEDDGAVMHVTMAQVRRRTASGAHVVVADGKGQASLRRIALDPETAAVVRRRVASAPAGGVVFTTGRGAAWHYSNFRLRCWEPAVDLAGLTRRPTPHWLRHTHAGWLLMSGAATLPEVQARIGHASITTTVGVYGSLVADVRPEALDAFAALRDTQPKRATPVVESRERP